MDEETRTRWDEQLLAPLPGEARKKQVDRGPVTAQEFEQFMAQTMSM